jgi:hypothetical protein
MKTNGLTFGVAFALGCLMALVVRSSRYKPYPEVATPHPALATSAAGEAVPEKTMTTVNRICPICGMDVDPSLPPAEYKGHKVGFGCAACPPRFAKDPDMYGPSALKNEVVE